MCELRHETGSHPTAYVRSGLARAGAMLVSVPTRHRLARMAHPPRGGAAKPRVSCSRTTAGLPNQLQSVWRRW